MDDLSQLGKFMGDEPVGQNLRKGIITAVNATFPPTLNVQIGGSSTSIPRVAYLSSYRPTVGDAVWLYKQDTMMIVLGRQAYNYQNGGPRDEFQKLTFNYNTPGHVVIYGLAFTAVPVTLLTLVGPGTYVPSIKAGSESTTQFVLQIFDMTTGLEIPNGTSVVVNVHTNGT